MIVYERNISSSQTCTINHIPPLFFRMLMSNLLNTRYKLCLITEYISLFSTLQTTVRTILGRSTSFGGGGGGRVGSVHSWNVGARVRHAVTSYVVLNQSKVRTYISEYKDIK